MKYILTLLIILLIGIQGWTLKTQQQILDYYYNRSILVDSNQLTREIFRDWFKRNENSRYITIYDMCIELATDVFSQLKKQSEVKHKSLSGYNFDTEYYKNATIEEQARMLVEAQEKAEEGKEYSRKLKDEVISSAIIYNAICD